MSVCYGLFRFLDIARRGVIYGVIDVNRAGIGKGYLVNNARSGGY